MVQFDLQYFKEIAINGCKTVIVTHMNPDGDSVGSSSALAMVLKKLGHTVVAITPNRSPEYLHAVEGFEYQIDYLEKTKMAVAALKRAELIICADFNDYKTRIGEVTSHIENNKEAKKVLFDHHIMPDSGRENFDLIFSDDKDSSTAHIVTKVLRGAGLEELVDKKVASALMAGIISDTGNFSYGALTVDLFEDVAFLISKGAEIQAINNALFNVKTESSLRLSGFAVQEKMIVDYKKKSAAIWLTKAELERFDYKSGDTDGLVNRSLSIKGIVNAALFTEGDGFIKISLRSLPKGCDMNKFARKYYTGGGHVNAAGAKCYNDILSAMKIYFDNI